MRGTESKARPDTIYIYCLAHLIPRESIQAPASRQQAQRRTTIYVMCRKPPAARILNGKARLCQDEARKRAHHRQGKGAAFSPKNASFHLHPSPPRYADEPINWTVLPQGFAAASKLQGPQEGPPSAYENYAYAPMMQDTGPETLLWNLPAGRHG
ncbi:hypothetical protein TGAM01_v208929 [Trichoderma gamsii]|uniref:Uncharacterized protein n=1 Tax=Trichoderma gamsii TaxID=398673 RepID=A0A2P4ZD85_9HYPO|nr:hypothetical protein TGAM01_v208929 [Trichoderma gamsii]PON22248.1 hypothetical protein TGAM01_v208929 [Trichoderma gamsii]